MTKNPLPAVAIVALFSSTIFFTPLVALAQPAVTKAPDAVPLAVSPEKFIIKQVNGKDSPDEIPAHVPIRVYLSSFKSISDMLKTRAEGESNIKRILELSDEQAKKTRDTLLAIYEQDQVKLHAYTDEICSPKQKEAHVSKSIDDFLTYLESHEKQINQELVQNFNAQLKSNLDESTVNKITAWIKEHTLPSVQHVEINKHAFYKANNITPAKFIDSFCKR